MGCGYWAEQQKKIVANTASRRRVNRGGGCKTSCAIEVVCVSAQHYCAQRNCRPVVQLKNAANLDPQNLSVAIHTIQYTKVQ